uniref:Vacuolar protein sorting-associated protein 52 A n=1 Tax=Oryza meridionalis TaxID=40149 RepID=A0A0E0EZ76_9ORYZ
MVVVHGQWAEDSFGGFFSFDEDAASEDMSLDGLDEELEEHKDYDVLISILANGEKQRDMATLVEGNLGHAEQDLIQDYVEDSDNLVLLHDQIHDCDIILSQIGSLLTGFQVHIGSINSELRSLQERSLDISVRLKNRKLVETKLAKFVEEIVAPPSLVTVIIDGEVNDGYAKSLEILSKKLRFSKVDPMINASNSLKDIKPELERLLQKALCKVSDYLTELFFSMRKPGTNIQILQQNMVQKYRYLILFLREHGSKVYTDVRATYADTMNKVLSAHFQVYIEALEKLKLDIGVSSDLTGYDTNIIDLISRGREHLRNHRFMFSLGERASILKVHQYGTVYLFIKAFFGEESLFYQVFQGPFKVINGHLDHTLRNYHDAVCLMLMICITRKHQDYILRTINLVEQTEDLHLIQLVPLGNQVLIYLWPRFKTVFDLYLQSLYRCDTKLLWVDGSHPHHIVRCYVEFTASLIQLNAECGDGQLDMNLERLRLAVDNLLGRLAENFANPKTQHLFLLNNYDMTISVLKEAGDEANKLQSYFQEKLESNMISFALERCDGLWMARRGWFKPAPMVKSQLYWNLDELLMEHFKDLIKFVRSRVSEDLILYTECPSIADVEPIVKNFAVTWKTALELMHNEVVTSCSNLLSGMEILKAAMVQLLNDYNRLSECVKIIPGGSTLNRNLVSITSISYEMRKYSITL